MWIIPLILLIPLAFVGLFFHFHRQETIRGKEIVKKAEKESAALRENANREAEEMGLGARKEAVQIRLDAQRQLEETARELEEEINEQELLLERESQRVTFTVEELRLKEESLTARSAALAKRSGEIGELKAKRKELLESIPGVLEQTAGLTREQMKETIYREMVERAENTARENLNLWEQVSEADFVPRAKRLLGIAMGRISRTNIQERPSNVVVLSRTQYQHLQKLVDGNLDRLSELFRIPVFAQEQEDVLIRFDTIDAVNREIARRVLEKALEPGRQAGSFAALTDFWEKKNAEMENEITGYGRKAFKLAGLKPRAHKDVIQLVGRLFFRTSYTQNQWLHSVEAAQLAGLIAAEMHLDVELARRATLLHDIGKALTHEVEGSHAVIGCELAERYGEDATVVNAIGAHHGEMGNESIYASLVMAADAMSGGRPGARREQLETYFDRIYDLERAARSFAGIQEVYAVQAGRELRVQVDSSRMDDARTMELASEISKKISEEVTFPGQVKVTVIRTYTAQEVAR